MMMSRSKWFRWKYRRICPEP